MALPMIGIIADPLEHDVVREFFELFKTPWEFYRSGRQYEVLLCAADAELNTTANLVLVYAGRKTQFDDKQKILTGRQRRHPRILSHDGTGIPIYGESITFREGGSSVLTNEDSQECAGYLKQAKGQVLARIGYDLFREIRALLTVGQPPEKANIPTIELHIGLLRQIITGCGLPLVEIPAVPDGYQFIACLTHDVDHPSIRQHKWDHAMFGFLYRAVFGSLRNFIRGRTSGKGLLTNWAAVLRLPFVYLGLANDFWREFDDRYQELEKDVSSTFFVVPFKNYSGKTLHGPAPRRRAARYGAKDIAVTIRKLVNRGHEVGLHGIDAWLDNSKGREELDEIRSLTGVSDIGVRMHWLFYSEQSPALLEKAGATYDSTIGYNETVGYRAGTTQAYKPLETNELLELPMHVMDTALFYPAYLDLSAADAGALLGRMADNAVQFGGCLTINWHDRSIAPERLWDESYRELLRDLRRRDAWFATAGQVVSWFRKRRSAVFEMDPTEPGSVRARLTVAPGDNLPALRLRIHQTQKSSQIENLGSEDYVDIAVNETVGSTLCETGR